ncbi:aminopeptidase I zinc metalloprotease-domain-containing protein [Scheffersomyces xylosifermentans]|uniref:aminopeptidase I zinc metalloprotease-domain-containing protein n=1 Tax=Scheffersomyces xylosifermentans TaxID=1304137 RepID=UPI00315CE742
MGSYNLPSKESFVVMDKNGSIISTDDEEEWTTDDEASETEIHQSQEQAANDIEVQPEREKTPIIHSQYLYQIPKVNISESHMPLSPPPQTEKQSDEQVLQDYYDSYADKYIEFMSNNPTTYHVITHFKSLLTNNGFTYVKENELFRKLDPGFYFTSKDDQTLIAFVIGGKWEPSQGSCFIASHCDALSIKLNPKGSIKKHIEDYELLGVAPYSGSLNDLWLNRDLGLAGAILVKDTKTSKVSRKLINSSPHPIGFIPQLAPHFGIEKTYNKQTEMVPIVSYSSDKGLSPTDEEKASVVYGKHPLSLLRYVSELSSTSLTNIVQLDLDLVDVQPAARGGVGNEFIYSSSLDDRLCSFDSIYGLIEFSQAFLTDRDINEYDGLNGIYLANNEEIGSATRTGAAGGFLIDTLKSVVSSRSKENAVEQVLELTNNTILLSTDVTHAFNPNFKDAYLEKNFPLPNTGPSIKLDSNGHVLSDSIADSFLQSIISKNLPDITLQHFHIRNDGRSGGTIGPIMSNGRRGINGAKLIIDVGLPILSMHSIRSTMGYKDVGIGIRFFREVFNKWQEEIKSFDLEKSS